MQAEHFDAELENNLGRELVPHVQSVSIHPEWNEKLAIPQERAILQCVDKEGKEFNVDMYIGHGYKIITSDEGTGIKGGKCYDTLHNLLMDLSPSYQSSFNQLLFSRLQAVADAASSDD